ncbi:hypothetical protein M3914_003565 [Vibrio metschnikovii]|nr:hypothetical protein [Vibrio metschnikovii]EKO3612340.1 hypothetical protein [Vibrio metschnikovii]EKO3685036.1 hypothetical protein [Vibrio metschnikovii]EKO3715674.1 hypothetical protein [Vibrio metschnikovii]
MKYLGFVFEGLIFVRESVFFLAHLLDKNNGRGPVLFPSFIVGAFDAMISFLVVLCIEKFVYPESRIIEMYLTGGIFNIHGYVWVLLVFLMDFIYYTIIFDGNDIIRRFNGFSRKKLKLVKGIGFTYIGFAFSGAFLAGYFS